MTQETPSFYTLDRGTVSTTAALIAPVDGRYRLLGSATAPAGIDPETVLEDLAWRVARTDASVAEPLDGWRKWSRLEVRSSRAPRAVLVAASVTSGTLLERAFVGAGWHISATSFEPRPDVVVLGEASLDPEVDAIVVGARDDADEEEQDHVRLLWPLAGSLARMRDDLAVVACGPFTERPERIPDDRLYSLPAPAAVSATTTSTLRTAAAQVGIHLAGAGIPAGADARHGLRTSIGSLAALLDDRVEGVEVGAAAGSRTLAHPDGEVRDAVLATGAFLPTTVLSESSDAEAILRWSALRGDPAGYMDRLRELCILPWSGRDPEGARLHLAALRAALERMQRVWQGGASGPSLDGETADDSADVIVLSGGAFATVPTAVAALALIDTVRRPGAATVLHDHAGVLAPLGALPVEGDRRRLLADLMDDILLPVGSAVLTGSLHVGTEGSGSVIISTPLGSDELPLEPDQLRLVDLPPGIVARLEIDPQDGTVLGVKGQRVTLEVSGGLGGLLVDTRDIALRLADSGEPRRTRLAAWEQPFWASSDR